MEGAKKGVNTMKKIVTFAALAAGALALAACGAKKEEEAAAPMAEETVAAEETPIAVPTDPVDETGNPIGPAGPNPIGPSAAEAAATPAAE